jgi:hypothetical protein
MLQLNGGRVLRWCTETIEKTVSNALALELSPPVLDSSK